MERLTLEVYERPPFGGEKILINLSISLRLSHRLMCKRVVGLAEYESVVRIMNFNVVDLNYPNKHHEFEFKKIQEKMEEEYNKLERIN